MRRGDIIAAAAAAILMIVLALIFVVAASASDAATTTLRDGDTLPSHKSITLLGLCSGWKAWRTREGGLWVGCPDGPDRPRGAVELRAYYVATP